MLLSLLVDDLHGTLRALVPIDIARTGGAPGHVFLDHGATDGQKLRNVVLVEVGPVVILQVVPVINPVHQVVLPALELRHWDLLSHALRDQLALALARVCIDLAVWVVMLNHIYLARDLLIELRYNLVGAAEEEVLRLRRVVMLVLGRWWAYFPADARL